MTITHKMVTSMHRKVKLLGSKRKGKTMYLKRKNVYPKVKLFRRCLHTNKNHNTFHIRKHNIILNLGYMIFKKKTARTSKLRMVWFHGVNV